MDHAVENVEVDSGTLEDIIQSEIACAGAISVARFMEFALYEPAYGYYRRNVDPFGISGDFFTAEQLQPLFGDLLSAYAAMLCRSRSCQNDTFAILELGSGRGELKEAFRDFNFLAYDWQGDELPSGLSGLVIANEFFDALPVHVLHRRAEGWTERRVNFRGGGFLLEDYESNLTEEMEDYLALYGRFIPVGGSLEVNIELHRWVERVSRLQIAGRFLIIDYGYFAPELARFPLGTVMSYKNHVADRNVFSNPGLRDITSHVNFSDLEDAAVRNGYRILANDTLADWAIRVWDETALEQKWATADQRWKLQWKQLLFGMGQTFRVLELEKAL